MGKKNKVSYVDSRLVGIQGWLLFLAIDLVVSPFLGAIWLICGSEPLNKMADYGFNTYVVSYYILHSMILIYTFIAALSFFKMKKAAVLSVILLLVFRAVVPLALFVIGVIVIGGKNQELIMLLLRSNNFIAYGVAAAVWTWYFIVSKRVKATFVR